MSAHLAYLPPELYTCILDYVTDQQTVLALTRCLPYAGISVDRLFHSIRIRQPETVPRLYRRIRAGLAQNASTSDASHLVYHLSVETWNVDADVLTNLLRLLPSLRTLIVWIGPSNFSPEHLEEMFKPPMHNLKCLSLRFRPYVRKATYYQFHKGSYFDSTLLALSTWPQGLPTLSIVQDTFTPDPSDLSPRFAQPIVFFRLALHLSLLIHSPASHASLTSLRIRIPARPIIQPLTIAYLHPTVPPISTNTNTVPPPPSLDFLDVATCNVSETDIEKLLMHFTRLKHLVLDECTNLPRAWSVSSQALGSELEWWSALGRRLVMAGVKRAREREKELRTWYEENFYRRSLRRDEDESQVHVEDERETQIYEPKRPKRGRRGLATATITLRGATTSPPRAGPAKKPSPERSRRHGAVSSSSSVSSIPVQNNQDHKSTLPLPKVHVVPPLPSLKSISLFPTPGPNTVLMTPEVRVRIKAEFEKGWYDGLRVLWEVRGRMGTTFMRRLVENKGKQVEGVLRPRFFVFRDQGGQDGEPKGEEREGHEGLDDVLPSEEDIFVRNEETSVDVGGPPVLCLAGSDVAAGGHEVGCGHFVGRDAGLESL